MLIDMDAKEEITNFMAALNLTSGITNSIQPISRATRMAMNSKGGQTITIKWPIEFNAYTEIFQLEDLPPEIGDLCFGHSMITRDFFDLLLLDTPTFIAKLNSVRAVESCAAEYLSPSGRKVTMALGNTYDPWFRDITSIGKSKYIEKSAKNYCIKSASDHSEVLYTWQYHSTIEKNPIVIVLYKIMKLQYVNTVKMRKHLDAIHPYKSYKSYDYDLKIDLS
jgi:hypothetical protein